MPIFPETPRDSSVRAAPPSVQGARMRLRGFLLPPRPARQERRAAFTLIELLAVVAIIGVLVAFLSGAIVRSVRNARNQRMVSERATLEAAVINYWHDYSRWPGPGISGDALSYTYKTDNYKVFEYLLYPKTSTNDKNPLRKAYIDENAFQAGLATSGPDKHYSSRTSVAGARSGDSLTKPIVGYNLATNGFYAFSVTIDFKSNIPSIGAPAP